MKRLFETGKGKNEGWKLPTDNEGFKFEGGKSEVEIDGVGVMDVIDRISDHYAINKEDAAAFIREVTKSDVDESDEMSVDEGDELSVDDSVSIDDLIVRHFTKELENNKDKNVFDLFSYELMDCLIKDYRTGETIVDMKDLEMPKDWGKNAKDIFASKYFRKASVPETGHETSIKQVFHRIATFYVESLTDEGIITSEDKAKIYYDEMVYMMMAQIALPNSPSIFTSGLKQVYGIPNKTEGLYHYDTKLKKVVEEDIYSPTSQSSACFLLQIQDQLLGDGSISNQFAVETKLYRGGSGQGTSYSSVRGLNEKISSGGVSSGVMSFMSALDFSSSSVKSGGAVRRAARMNVLDIDHLDIMDFITVKAREEQKVRDLIRMGYDSHFDGEAYASAKFQSSNNSVGMFDFFMKKIDKKDSTIMLKGVVDDSLNHEVKVEEMWDAIAESCWSSGDPGLLFLDTANKWFTSPNEINEDGEIIESKIITSNP